YASEVRTDSESESTDPSNEVSGNGKRRLPAHYRRSGDLCGPLYLRSRLAQKGDDSIQAPAYGSLCLYLFRISLYPKVRRNCGDTGRHTQHPHWSRRGPYSDQARKAKPTTKAVRRPVRRY